MNETEQLTAYQIDTIIEKETLRREEELIQYLLETHIPKKMRGI